MEQFRNAVLKDTEAISRLVNMAYRDESSRMGWTTEADFLEGLRTSVDEIENLVKSKDSSILLCLHNYELLGSICIKRVEATVHIGMFAVNPIWQARGIGKNLLSRS